MKSLFSMISLFSLTVAFAGPGPGPGFSPQNPANTQFPEMSCLQSASNRELMQELNRRLYGNHNGASSSNLKISAFCGTGGVLTATAEDFDTGKSDSKTISVEYSVYCESFSKSINSRAIDLTRGGKVAGCYEEPIHNSYGTKKMLLVLSFYSNGSIALQKVETQDYDACRAQAASINSKP